jgi:hypothetical protein
MAPPRPIFSAPRAIAPPAPAPAPVPAPAPKPSGMFTSLDDILAHVADLKQRRLGQLHAASAVLQRALIALLRACRSKADAQAQMVLIFVSEISVSNTVEALDAARDKTRKVLTAVSTRATVRPFFLRPINRRLRPEAVDAHGDPVTSLPGGSTFAFREPADVSTYVDFVRDTRLAKLNTAQVRVRGAFWRYAGRLNLQGNALAEGTSALLRNSLCVGRSAVELNRHMRRLACLKAALPASALSVQPFLAALTVLLPPASDVNAAVKAGLMVPTPVFSTVDDVLAYGSTVHDARLQRLHACQVTIRSAYMTFAARLLMRAEALAVLASTRIRAMSSAPSDLALKRLMAATLGASKRVPKFPPATLAFPASCHAKLSPAVVQYSAKFEDADGVLAYAAATLDARMLVLHACATRVAATFRTYRYNMQGIGSALGALATSILYGFNTATSDLVLARLVARLDGTLARVPNIPEVKLTHLQVRLCSPLVVRAGSDHCCSRR